MLYPVIAPHASRSDLSFFFRPVGPLRDKTNPGQAATLTADIPLRSSLTLTAQAGEMIPHAVMVATLITSFFALVTVIGQGIRARARARRASND